MVYYAFDLLQLDGVDVAGMTLLERKERLAAILKNPPAGIAFSEHEGGDGEAFRRAACRHGLEGIVSKRTDRRYLPGDRGVWLKSKCLNRAEFVIVGWSDPEGSRHGLGALLLGYYEADGRLLHAGRVGTGMSFRTLAMLHERLSRWRSRRCRLPSRRLAGPASAARWRCARWTGFVPKLVAEITYLSWSDDGLLCRRALWSLARYALGLSAHGPFRPYA